MSKNKLVLIDGNSLFYKAFYALPLLQNSNGEFSNAIYGFCNILTKIIKDYSPTHMIVCFDAAKHTFRNDLYAEYKQNRKPMPTELASQREPLVKLLKLMNIKVLDKIGVEADDLLGTIAHRFLDDTLIVTGDRDCFQLIDDNTHICFTRKGITEVEIIDATAFENMYGFEPIHIVDLKALQGDASDNIPGAKGVGEKTALSLIQKYRTVENVYKNIDEITGKMKENLVNSRELVKLSKVLATINDKVDIGCEIEDCTFEFPFNQSVYDYMVKYNFRTLIKREDLFQNISEVKPKISVEINNIENEKQLSEIAEKIKKTGEFACAFLGEDIHISCDNSEYIIKTQYNLLNDGLTFEKFFNTFKNVFENDKIKKVAFDIKALKHLLNKEKIELNGEYFDVAIAKHLVDGISVKDFENTLIQDGYGVETCASALIKMKLEYIAKIKELDMERLYYEVELPLVSILYDMEKTGFMVDQSRLKELGEEYVTELHTLEEKIYSLAGEKFNIDSPKQLGIVLFEKLNLPHDKKKSTDIDQLLAIENAHDIVPLVIRYRKLAKLNGTYIKGMKDRIATDGKIHTNFKQTLTTTGRLSSTDPNLQNLPIRTEEFREIRSMFVASTKENVLVDVDYSQIELRLLAHFSGDEKFVAAFQKGEDIHSSTACGIFGVTQENITREMRRTAKVVNFGIIYGISEYGLAKDLGIAPYSAKEYIRNYYLEHSKVKEFMENTVKMAKETGRVSTLLNRSRKMIDITASNAMVRSRAERASQNMKLQGSAADIIKLAMVGVYNKLKQNNLKAKLIMQVHDELIVDCPKQEENIVMQILKEEMENVIKLNVPLIVEGSSSYRWSEGH